MKTEKINEAGPKDLKPNRAGKSISPGEIARLMAASQQPAYPALTQELGTLLGDLHLMTDGPMATGARGSVALEGVPPEKISDFNLRGLDQPEELRAIADQKFAGRPVRLATAGYSAPPKDTPYELNTRTFLGALINTLGPDQVGLVTSPTADAGSVDAITTTIGQRAKVPVLNITAKDYVDYIDPSKFPESIDRAAYAAEPKFVFPDGARYSAATAVASNVFIATGGRDVTVGDFVNAIKAGNKVVVVLDQSLGGAQWDDAKGRPNNGAAYLGEMLRSNKGAAHPFLPKKGFDAAFLESHASKGNTPGPGARTLPIRSGDGATPLTIASTNAQNRRCCAVAIAAIGL